MYKVYAEAVFADNFVVNFLILLFASRLSATRVRWGRCALAAAAGGVYAAAVFGADGFAVSIYMKLTVSLIMCAVAFLARGERHVWKNLAAFYVATFVFAGAIMAISLCMGQQLASGGALAVQPAVRAVLFGLSAGAGLIGVYSHIRRRISQREPHTAVMALRFGDKKISVKTYIDTGNLVTEPLTGLPVIFLSRSAAEKLLGRKLSGLLAGNGAAETDKLRVIPCATATGQAVLYGLELDGVRLAQCGESTKAVACVARSAPSGGCGAVVGSNLTDELKKGAYHEKPGTAKDRGVGAAALKAGGAGRLHQRQRGAAPAALGGGGGGAAGAAGQGGQIGAQGADRAESAAGGVHRAQV